MDSGTPCREVMQMARVYHPRPYQEYATNRILDTRYIALLLDMGMGKTAATLTAIEKLLYDRFEVDKVLVIAPLRVAATVWSDESREWEHLHRLRVSRVLGSEQERLRALARRADVYAINRENIPWLVEHYKTRWPFDMVVIDESSSFKNPQSKRFKALRRILPKIHRIVELTGTPAPNGLMDLWSQIYLLDHGQRLGSTLGEYRRRWFRPGACFQHVVYDWRPNRNAEKEIMERISDICVSMKSEDYISLPPVLHNIIKVQLPKAAMDAYRRMERDLVLPIADAEIDAGTAAALSNKLLQMANGAVYTDEEGHVSEIHSAKLDALEEAVESNGHKPVLVFYWFKHDLARLKERFPKARKLETANDIRDWNDGKVPVLLAHPASAGHGLNLQHGGSIILWFSLTWSLELYQQANKRLHRPGQTETVVIHHLVADGTIDRDVMAALEAKRAGQDALLEALKARIKGYGGEI